MVTRGPWLVIAASTISRSFVERCPNLWAKTARAFTSLQWVGMAENPDAIATLIDIHERVNGGDA
ncbi:hypothetical protein ABT255_60510 [Streptomyces mirabilis]|uniref:hypothetical protein n=1 Tax=Streptomyces mirabilis TaxID=68239 RepID=UPI00332634EA